MFKTMEDSIADEILKIVKNIGVQVSAPAPEKFTEGVEQPVYRNRIPGEKSDVAAQTAGSANSNPGNSSQSQAQPQVPTVGRNDLCPCGSGKKFKKCHGK